MVIYLIIFRHTESAPREIRHGSDVPLYIRLCQFRSVMALINYSDYKPAPPSVNINNYALVPKTHLFSFYCLCLTSHFFLTGRNNLNNIQFNQSFIAVTEAMKNRTCYRSLNNKC